MELLQSFLSNVLKRAFSIANYRKPVIIYCPPDPHLSNVGETCSPTSYGCAALAYITVNMVVRRLDRLFMASVVKFVPARTMPPLMVFRPEAMQDLLP